MSAPEAPRPTRSLEVASPTLGQMLARALVKAVVRSGVLSVIIVFAVFVIGLLIGKTPRLFGLSYLGGWSLAVSFVIFFVLGFIGQSRPLQDRAFTITGIAATFFGLAMLVIFFQGLLHDVASYFYYQPMLIEQTNQITLVNRKELGDVEAGYNREVRDLKKELREGLADSATEEDKKAFLERFLGPGGTFDDKDGKWTMPLLDELRVQEQDELKAAKDEDKKKAIRAKYKSIIVEKRIAAALTLRDLEVTLDEKRTVAARPLRGTSGWDAFWFFMFESPSSTPESVGIRPAILGSMWLAIIMILFAVPVGVGAALYLEEYRTKGRLGHLIQVNINNLAGVPSIVYGILGAFLFVELIFKPIHLLNHNISVRNVIGGGLTLGLLTLPVVIVSAQEAIKAVPSSIRQGAYALGATHWQVIWQQVLPMARPGILTGTILSVSRAIGEAAPLVLFGATTFIAYNPTPISDFTVLPIQIYNWAERPNNPGIDRLAAASGNDVRVWEALSGNTLGELHGHTAPVRALAFGPSGKRLLSGSDDHTLRYWDAESYRSLKVLQGHSAPVTSVAMWATPGRTLALSGSKDQTARLWDVELNESGQLQGHQGAVTSVALSGDGRLAVTGSEDRTVKLWDVASGKLVSTLTGHKGPVTSVAFRPDGEYIFSGSVDKTIRVWSVSKTSIAEWRKDLAKGKGEVKPMEGKLERTLEGHEGPVTAVAYAQGRAGKLVASASEDKTVRIWDYESGNVLQTYKGHADGASSVDFLSRQLNGQDFLVLASGGKDGAIHYWEMVTGRDLHVMRAAQPLHGAVFDPATITVQAWHFNMALASLVLLVVLLLLNGVAIILRNRAQRRVRL